MLQHANKDINSECDADNLNVWCECDLSCHRVKSLMADGIDIFIVMLADSDTDMIWDYEQTMLLGFCATCVLSSVCTVLTL